MTGMDGTAKDSNKLYGEGYIRKIMTLKESDVNDVDKIKAIAVFLSFIGAFLIYFTIKSYDIRL